MKKKRMKKGLINRFGENKISWKQHQQKHYLSYNSSEWRKNVITFRQLFLLPIQLFPSFPSSFQAHSASERFLNFTKFIQTHHQHWHHPTRNLFFYHFPFFAYFFLRHFTILLILISSFSSSIIYLLDTSEINWDSPFTRNTSQYNWLTVMRKCI